MDSSDGISPKRNRKPIARFSECMSFIRKVPPKLTIQDEMAIMKARYEKRIKRMNNGHERTKDCARRSLRLIGERLTSAAQENERLRAEIKANDEKIEELEEEMNEWKKTEDHVYLQKVVNEAREQATVQRKIALSYLAVMAKGQEDFSDIMNARKLCEICTLEYGPTVTPRVLPCGHTICEPCIERMMNECKTKIKCPFDRTEIAMKNRSVKDFPKNFWILNE